MAGCVTPYREVNKLEEVEGVLKTFPGRLNSVLPRITSGSVSGVSVESYHKDNRLWKKHVKAYKNVNKLLDTGRYRNIMDINAGLGNFAAAIESPKLLVMNVVSTIAEKSTLGVIYERGHAHASKQVLNIMVLAKQQEPDVYTKVLCVVHHISCANCWCKATEDDLSGVAEAQAIHA